MSTRREVEELIDRIVLLPDAAQLEILEELLEMHAEDLGLYDNRDDAGGVPHPPTKQSV